MITSLERDALLKKKSITFEEINKRRGAKEAWASLKDISELDREAVKRCLEAIANQKPSFRWHPPLPRDARRLAELLKNVVPRIRSMNIYFSSTLPLGNPNFRKLPEIVEQYASALNKAASLRQKQRLTSSENRDRELEVVRLLAPSDGERERAYYLKAVTLIQAAYNASYDAGFIKQKIVDTDSLWRTYKRHSYRYRRSSPTKRPK
jgi:hypothetical protein